VVRTGVATVDDIALLPEPVQDELELDLWRIACQRERQSPGQSAFSRGRMT